jgi:hypothetical protein
MKSEIRKYLTDRVFYFASIPKCFCANGELYEGGIMPQRVGIAKTNGKCPYAERMGMHYVLQTRAVNGVKIALLAAQKPDEGGNYAVESYKLMLLKEGENPHTARGNPWVRISPEGKITGASRTDGLRKSDKWQAWADAMVAVMRAENE